MRVPSSSPKPTKFRYLGTYLLGALISASCSIFAITERLWRLEILLMAIIFFLLIYAAVTDVSRHSLAVRFWAACCFIISVIAWLAPMWVLVFKR